MELVGRTPGRAGPAARVIQWTLVLLLISAAILFSGLIEQGALLAQSSPPVVLSPGDITPDQINEIAKEIWCPLCNNVRLDTCELKACDQMKEVIAIKLAEGQGLEEIRSYFVLQYGPQVLGEPPREGFNWLAWILPVLALVVGGYAFWRKTNSLVRATPQAASSAGARPARTSGAPDDYERKLEEELARYG